MTIDSPRALPDVDRLKIARYAGASGDFNPMHVDEAFARQAGMPSVIAHGPLTVSLVVDALVAQGLNLTAVRSRLRAPVFPGESLALGPAGEGPGLQVTKEDGTVAVSVEIAVR
ncbi:MAG: MaoC/PaaZ C-terminal domain-containing protein [Actinomycetota bacterium]